MTAGGEAPNGKGPAGKGPGGKGARDRSVAKRRAWRRGLSAEWIAALFLLSKGYRPMARRYRTPLGEIDLVVRRGKLVAFVEVKARASMADALEAVGAASERRIVGAADLWRAKHPDAAGLDLRFDMVLVTPWRLPKPLPDAFRPGRNGTW